MLLEKKQNNSPLSQQIAAHLQEKIAAGMYPVGTKLPTERALAELFGVSRIPVREGLKILAQLGIVQTVHGSGTYVQDRTDQGFEQVLELYLQLHAGGLFELLQLRRVLEQGALDLARQNIANGKEEPLSELERLERLCLNGHSARACRAEDDLHFHMKLCALSCNALLLRLINSIHGNLVPVQQQVITLGGAGQTMALEHLAILQALRSHNASQATLLLERHLLREQNIALELIRRARPCMIA